jgi:hypothetical protein
LIQLVEWAKHIPHFKNLPLGDQVLLLRAGRYFEFAFIIFTVFQLLFIYITSFLFFSGWNELMIAAFSHRSINVKDGIVLATGLTVDRDSAHQAGVEAIFDRVLTELVAKMKDMNMDRTELGCLRTIILFNPGNVPVTLFVEVNCLNKNKLFVPHDNYYFYNRLQRIAICE